MRPFFPVHMAQYRFMDSFLLITHLNRSKINGAWKIFPVTQEFQSTLVLQQFTLRKYFPLYQRGLKYTTQVVKKWQHCQPCVYYRSDIIFCLLTNYVARQAMMYTCFEIKRDDKKVLQKHMAPRIQIFIALIIHTAQEAPLASPLKGIPSEFTKGETWFSFHGAFSKKRRIAFISGENIV